MANGDRRWFGKPDPYCWLAVVPVLLVSGLAVTFGAVLLGGLGVVAALSLLAFDSWVNRPEQSVRHRRRDPGCLPSPGGTRFTPGAPRAGGSGSSRATRRPTGRPRGRR